MRRTKQEAQATRGRILDAAERLFQARGVSATSLHDIAQEAGVTRGAVYWHFRNKSDLFEAMLSRVTLPIRAASSESLDRVDASPPLARLREHVAALLACIAGDEQTRRVFDIVTTRVEYVDEMSALRERQALSCRDYLVRLEAVFDQAQHAGAAPLRPPARTLALGLFALVDGLIRNWVINPRAFDLQADGMAVVDQHLAGLAAQVPRGRGGGAAPS